MSAPVLTPWFKRGTKPTRPGVYQVRFPRGSIYFSKWTGKQWCLCALSADDAASVAASDRSHDCYTPRYSGWRGLYA